MCSCFCIIQTASIISLNDYLHKNFLSNDYSHTYARTRARSGTLGTVQRLCVSRLSCGQLRLVIKPTCSVTFSFQALVSLSESVAYSAFPPCLRQCANNYREPEASCLHLAKRLCSGRDVQQAHMQLRATYEAVPFFLFTHSRGYDCV